MNTWDGVARMLDAGKDPVIHLSYAQMKPATPKRPGRKRVQRIDKFEYANYVSGYMTGVVSRPRCVNPACKKRLKVDQLLVCSSGCHEQAVSHFDTLLRILREGGLEPLLIREVPDVSSPGGQSDAVRALESALAGGRAKRKGRPRGRRDSRKRAPKGSRGPEQNTAGVGSGDGRPADGALGSEPGAFSSAYTRQQGLEVGRADLY